MEIRSVAKVVQTVPEVNVNVGTSGSDTQSTVQQTNVVDIGLKGNQRDGSNQTGSNSKELSEKEVGKAVDKLNKLLEDNATHAEYEVYGKSKDLTVRIVNNKTKEVVQELPPKKIIDMIDKLCELAGLFVDKKA
ncbi:flagellar protein FlaG [Clostridiaceae bacterium UIB06]|nr:flagellar protein FlaG [Clostridiaceae bacterium UIB06]